MDISGVDYMKTSLLSYMHSIINVAITPQKEYQIPASAVLDILGSFSRDGSRSALNHLHLIEERCMLFKLVDISKEEVKRKLLYSSLYGDARTWF
jgi:hypothetical protein